MTQNAERDRRDYVPPAVAWEEDLAGAPGLMAVCGKMSGGGGGGESCFTTALS